jgi:hypothetical protein
LANVQVVIASSNPDIFGVNRCIVRTSGDRVYVVPTVSVASNLGVWMWKGNVDGEPTSFSVADVTPLISITGLQQIGAAAAIDSADIIHIMFSVIDTAMDGLLAVRYVQFDTSTDTFGTPETIATLDAVDTFTQRLGICVDANDDPHVIWRDVLTDMGASVFHNYYSNKTGASWRSRVSVSSSSNDLTLDEDIMIADPASSVNADRPIILEKEGSTQINVYHGTALDATAFTSVLDITGATDIDSLAQLSFAIDSEEKITVAFVEGTSLDLMVVEHLNSSAWGTWETPATVNSSADYQEPSIAIDGTNRYIYVEERVSSDIELWKDLGAGWAEETSDPDLPNVGTFTDVKAKWASKNNNTPEAFDYIFLDSTGKLWYNTFSESGFAHSQAQIVG